MSAKMNLKSGSKLTFIQFLHLPDVFLFWLSFDFFEEKNDEKSLILPLVLIFNKENILKKMNRKEGKKKFQK